MISMEQPSLVIHSHNVPGYKYQMDITWTAPATLTPSVLVGWIEIAINRTPEFYLKNVIINCHGSPGYLSIGTGLGIHDLEPFTRLRQMGSIGRIWLVACKVHDTRSGLGRDFCSKLAQKSGASVAAADELQYVNFPWVWLPYGYIDDFEGALYVYDGAGQRSLL